MSSFTESIETVAAALEHNSKRFEELDSVAGDGDLGITAGNIELWALYTIRSP